MSIALPPDGPHSLRRTTERRDLSTRGPGVWTEAERERFIAEIREARRDAHAVTVQGESVVPAPPPGSPEET